MEGWIFVGIVVFIVVVSALKVVNQYERGVKFTLGRYVGEMPPGLRVVIPVFQTWRRVSMRVRVVDVPAQECVTKDNISVRVNAVLYFRIEKASKAILEVEDYGYAVSQLAQTTMRNTVGEAELDELLAERERLSERIRQLVDTYTDPWGVKVQNVELKDVRIPEDMQRTIAKQAEAEREKRASIIRAEGEVTAAENWAAAAKRLAEVPGGLHLRTLQSINDLSSDQSNTVVLCMPLEVLRAVERLADYPAGEIM